MRLSTYCDIPKEIWKMDRRPHYPPDETAGGFSLPEISAPFRVRVLYFRQLQPARK